jgi:hypothetical protein
MTQSHLQLVLWALPLFLCIHVFEEFAYPGGFIQWMATHNSRRLKSPSYYIVINAAAILLGAIVAAIPPTTIGYCLHIWLVTFMATNGLSHAIASVQAQRYSPGTVTGSILFFPLLAISSWILVTGHLINWQSWGANVMSALAVGYFFITVHRRGKVVPE